VSLRLSTINRKQVFTNAAARQRTVADAIERMYRHMTIS